MAIQSADFDYICKLVRDRSAIVLEPGKEYLVESRLAPLARREGYASLDALVSILRTRSLNGIHQKVVEAMTTNETTFFRDLHPFDALKKTILPEWQSKRAPGQKLNIWSAACSSGQEAYSIAMLLHEYFPNLANGGGVSILATDISQEMLQRTRNGRYSQLEVNRGLPAPLLMKYFEKQGLEWQVKESLRRLVEVRELNLANEWGLIPQMDVIFIRNVLIYFDVATKKIILGRMRKVLRPEGYLFLGAAETTLNLDDNFTRVQFDRASCYKSGRS